MDIDLSDERKSLTACETEIKLGISEFEVLNVLYRRINDWVSIQDIEEELHQGINPIRMTMQRISGKLERSGIDPEFLMEKRWGGYHRLRGFKSLQWL